MTKQHALDQLRRNRGTVERNELAFRSTAEPMNGARHQFFPVPDSPVTRIVELESLMRSILRATSHIARLLNTMPGSELAEVIVAGMIVVGLLVFSTTVPDAWCARWATSLSAFNSLAC